MWLIRKGFMDTNAKAVMVSKRRGTDRHHPLALKWAIVEETLQPGASVAQIARKHGANRVESAMAQVARS